MFSNRRYMSGASTNPDPDVFAYCASTVKSAMDVTHRLGGENYVLWGGREGYETLLNTDLDRELQRRGHQEDVDQMMLGDRDRVIAKFIGQNRLLQHVRIEPVTTIAFVRVIGGKLNAEIHPRSLSYNRC